MNKLITLPLIAITALGLSACTQKATTENVTINDTSANLDAPADANLTDNAADGTLENSSNAL
jgi:hypothetical protein